MSLAAITRQGFSFLEKHPWYSMVLIILMAISVRIPAFFSFQNSLYGDVLLLDEKVYHEWALRLVSGELGALSVPDFAPLPAYVMAAVYSLLSPDPFWARLLNLMLGVTVCAVIFLIGKKLGGYFVGLASGLIASLYKPFIFFSVVLHKTAMSVFLFSGFIYACLALLDLILANGRSWNRGALAAALSAGVIMGLLINVRPNALIMLPPALICVGWSLIRDRSTWGTGILIVCSIVVGFAITVLPFAMRDYRLTKEIKPTPASGFNLYIANNPYNPLPYYRPVPFAASTVTEQAIGFIIEASRRQDQKLTAGEASTYWTREVIKYVTQQPADFIWKTVLKVMAVFNSYESADNHHPGFLKTHISFLKWPFFTIGLIMPLGMAGLFLLGFSSRKRTIATLSCIFYGATMIIFFSNIRIRLPLMVILIPFAVMGVDWLFAAVKKKRLMPAGIYIALVFLFFLLAFSPIPGNKDFTAYINIHASILASKGQMEEAIALWEQSAGQKHPYSAFAALSLAGIYLYRDDFEKASACIENIPDNSIAAAQKYETMGDLLLKKNRAQEALEAYRKSLEINYGQRRVHLKLYRLYRNKEPGLAEREYAVFKYISSFYNPVQK